MNNSEFALIQLKKDTSEMAWIVKNQINRTKECIELWDKDLVYEISAVEKRIDTYDLKITIDVENILALYNPVASDLRLVLACYNICSNLERIGDNARKIANLVKDFDKPIDNIFKTQLKFDEMFSQINIMAEETCNAFENEDSKSVRILFKQDIIINEIYQNSHKITAELIKNHPNSIEQLLYLYTISKKIERMGDLFKNIAEEIVFYAEAEILKHSKTKIKK